MHCEDGFVIFNHSLAFTLVEMLTLKRLRTGAPRLLACRFRTSIFPGTTATTGTQTHPSCGDVAMKQVDAYPCMSCRYAPSHS